MVGGLVEPAKFQDLSPVLIPLNSFETMNRIETASTLITARFEVDASKSRR